MLCERCHTTTGANDEACRSCGTPVRKLNRSWSKLARISIVTLVVTVFVVYVVLYNFDMIDFGFFEDVFTGAPAAAGEPVDFDPSEDGQYYDEGQTVYSEYVLPMRRSVEEQHALLEEIFEAVSAYVRDHSPSHPIISSGGWLYNAAKDAYVTVELLAGLNYLEYEQSAKAEGMLILYLRPMDLAAFEEVKLDGLGAASTERMTIFLAHEVPQGLALFSSHGQDLIFRESINKVFADYMSDNREISRPVSGDAVYRAVTAMVSSFVMDDIFVRYLAVDDVHGFIAFSTRGRVDAVQNFVLLLNGDEQGRPQLLARDFETTLHPVVAINGAAPSFNFDLMPDYDIARVELLGRDEALFADVLQTMVQNGQKDEEDEPLFVSVTHGFAYIVLADNSTFLGQHSAGGWSVVPVEGWRAAELTLVEFAAINPPLFLIWQN